MYKHFNSSVLKSEIKKMLTYITNYVIDFASGKTTGIKFKFLKSNKNKQIYLENMD